MKSDFSVVNEDHMRPLLCYGEMAYFWNFWPNYNFDLLFNERLSFEIIEDDNELN